MGQTEETSEMTADSQKAGDQSQGGNASNGSGYMLTVWNSVLQPFLVDFIVILIIALMLWGSARILLFLGASRLGITGQHVDNAAFLLGGLYLVGMMVTATRRLYFNICRNVCVRKPISSNSTDSGSSQCSNQSEEKSSKR